jgi:predicted fused transcriptional regulator/phosphomethylpyrimidine kinase
MSLLEFIEKNPTNSDKVALGYIDHFYDRLFTPRKNNVKNLLEIGIWEGDSLLLWRDYFTNAKIVGADIKHCPRIDNEPHITQHTSNAYTAEFLMQFKKEQFDIIIDDGPHTFETQSYFLTNYLPLLKKDGVLILEDIIDLNWTPKLLELVDDTKYKVTVVDMRLKQRDPQLLERWRSGLDIVIIENIITK